MLDPLAGFLKASQPVRERLKEEIPVLLPGLSPHSPFLVEARSEEDELVVAFAELEACV